MQKPRQRAPTSGKYQHQIDRWSAPPLMLRVTMAPVLQLPCSSSSSKHASKPLGPETLERAATQGVRGPLRPTDKTRRGARVVYKGSLHHYGRYYRLLLLGFESRWTARAARTADWCCRRKLDGFCSAPGQAEVASFTRHDHVSSASGSRTNTVRHEPAANDESSGQVALYSLLLCAASMVNGSMAEYYDGEGSLLPPGKPAAISQMEARETEDANPHFTPRLSMGVLCKRNQR